MADVKVKFHCGCGFSTTESEEAVKHCNEKNHTLTAVGTINKDQKKR